MTDKVYIDHRYTLQKDNLEMEAYGHGGFVHLREKPAPNQLTKGSN